MALSYERVHHRLTENRGPAKVHPCIACGRQALDWAYQYSAGSAEITDSKGRKYSEDPEDYQAMCRKCHIAHDMEKDPESLMQKYQVSRSYPGRRLAPDAQLKGARNGGRAIGERFQSDPEFAARKRAQLSAGTKLNRKCGDCDKVSTASVIARHQRSVNHEGVVILDGVS